LEGNPNRSTHRLPCLANRSMRPQSFVFASQHRRPRGQRPAQFYGRFPSAKKIGSLPERGCKNWWERLTEESVYREPAFRTGELTASGNSSFLDKSALGTGFSAAPSAANWICTIQPRKLLNLSRRAPSPSLQDKDHGAWTRNWMHPWTSDPSSSGPEPTFALHCGGRQSTWSPGCGNRSAPVANNFAAIKLTRSGEHTEGGNWRQDHGYSCQTKT
jgi:hypothetical protein